MSERGVFAVDRGIWEHDFLADDQPFSRREAWVWLLSEAAWKPHRRRIAGRVIELQRGQYTGSLRFIASKWRWSEPRVRRFLSGLISEQMIDAKTDAGVTVITICNYDAYQRVSLPSDAMRESDGDASPTQERRKVEDMEDKEDTKANALAPPSAGRPVYEDSRHELWGEGVPILVTLGVADRQARAVIGKWLKTASDDAQAVLGAIQRARDNRVIDPIPWITQAIGASHGKSVSQTRTATPTGRATTREAQQIAAMGRGAARRFEERNSTGPDRPAPGDAGVAEVFDFGRRAEAGG